MDQAARGSSIRSSNPELISYEDEIDAIITDMIRKKSIQALDQFMAPSIYFQGWDSQIDALLLGARIIPLIPKIATNIGGWITSYFNVQQAATQQQQHENIKNKSLEYKNRLLTKVLCLRHLTNSNNFSVPRNDVKQLSCVQSLLKRELFQTESCMRRLLLAEAAIRSTNFLIATVTRYALLSKSEYCHMNWFEPGVEQILNTQDNALLIASFVDLDIGYT